ncbi:MAG: hypothetical protein NTY88_02030 [Bacteroidetes bacterium]|nr:hypothetical protein [Bacteroidota bacterium]
MMTKIASQLIILALSVSSLFAQTSHDLAKSIEQNPDFKLVKEKAQAIIKTGFNAGDGYIQVWIRDLNTFIELAMDANQKEVENALLVFFKLQAEDGNILDGYTPAKDKKPFTKKKDCVNTTLAPNYCGHKNTVATDQETSLIQAVYKYVTKTGNTQFLQTKVGEITVAQRMEMAMLYLMKHKWTEKYGLIIGAATADWGDVQQSGFSGVDISKKTKFCADIYDNAMMIIALKNMMEIIPETKSTWQPICDSIAQNTMKYLWDNKNQKFIPHLYLDGSPYPASFDENKIFYHGGTAVAIEAGLLSKEQIQVSLQKMKANIKESGAASIGLTLYPVYPKWAFENPGLTPWQYQNGGDWTWFGGRMIQQLVRFGFVEDAYECLQPMTARAAKNNGFYEWYTKENKPKGSGTFRGEAGVLYKSIIMLEDWSKNQIKN